LYSFKFKNSGVRTQVKTDINDIVVTIINKADCLAFDSGYNYYIEDFLEKTINF
ncbi:hypothetical protein BDF14DRAFT_1703498, partial [Spinellus fusiger]